MVIKYLALGDADNITPEEFCSALSECGELGAGLLDTKKEAQAEAERLVAGGVFEVKIEYKKV